ncbi:sodium/calcium exchanger 1 [Adelges cooleyi]|uniref:sodium/calcium exchanger 1 n=1 Tax=Adelges cooleyi TaxID=133065 RepID=UPI00217F2B53|nr:sodium/calcium exchanger 1 [Adelges cooleyi]
MGHGNASTYPWGPEDVCPGGLILPIFDERLWPIKLRVVIYILALMYSLLGISIVTDVFMIAIDKITSHTKKIYLAKELTENGSNAFLRPDQPEVIEVRVWNPTIANLTLMALGTSSPEILLSIIETVGHHFEARKLGPNIIVGSAAFNLLIITSLCTLTLGLDEKRRIHDLKVFLVIGAFSFFAYIWLLLIIDVISPNVIELWEAAMTFLLFPILMFFAYATDTKWCGKSVAHNKHQMDLVTLENQNKPHIQPIFNNGKLDKENLLNFVRNVKKYPGITDADAAKLAATKLLDSSHRGAMWYRIGAVRRFTGGKQIEPVLTEHLKQVYAVLKSDKKGGAFDALPPVPAVDNKFAIVEFHSPNVAVKENIGTFPVTIWRHGNLKTKSIVRVDSINGTAKEGEDYDKVKEIVRFEEDEEEKQINVKILDDNQWEPDEVFFLRLSVVHQKDLFVKLGSISIIEVTIIDNDEPGIISFGKRGLLVKESAGFVEVPIVRTHGSDSEVTVKWRTIDESAISGRDYVGGQGEIIFKDKEVAKVLKIEIINDMCPEKDECFEIELYGATGGAKIGNVNRTAVTISSDDDFDSVVDRLMLLTNINIHAIELHRQTWAEQIKAAMTVNGGDLENATTATYVMHFFSFFWKVLFSFIPPATIFYGWPRFFSSLILIGIMATTIGDLATIFGCLIGLDDIVTAITVVALGMSLPDILGACMVTRAETHADEAMIHIAGSIAVKVLMGVGLPWFIAALYHHQHDRVFNVPSNQIGTNVVLYSIMAILAVSVLMVRRNMEFFGKAELGGPQKGRYLTVGIFVVLWLIYLFLTCFQTF